MMTPDAFEEARSLVVRDCRFRASEWRRYGKPELAEAFERIEGVVAAMAPTEAA
jgi:hypothetical protein